MRNPRKLEIKGKYLLVACAALLLIICAAVWYNLSQQDTGADGYTLSIEEEGKVLKTFSLREIEKMDQIQVYANLQSASHENAEGIFQGVELRTLLELADPDLLDRCDTFICTAGDGYSSAISAKEAAEEKNAIVAWAKDGKPFLHFNEGGQGPLRLVMAGDTYGNRSTKFLVRIQCRPT